MLERLSWDSAQLMAILPRVLEPTIEGKYLHWEKLRHYTPPPGLSVDDWWLGLKVRRSSGRVVPLRGVDSRPFSFLLVDPLPECLHHVDSQARGAITMPEPIVNPETSSQYLLRSLLDEAITSSQLEGASTTRAVAKRMIRENRKPRDRSEQMIYNNYLTMQYIREIKGEPLTKDLVFRVHHTVTEATLDDPSGAGRFRRPGQQVAVVDETGEVLHDPPPAEELEGRMEVMCRFANGEIPDYFVHPLIRSIILHFWLAYDHPFVDGNGRTARALFYWSMIRHGYCLFEYISISKTILQSPVKYGMAFLHSETDENDLTYFLLYHVEVVRKAIDELHAYIERRTAEVRRVEAELRGLTSLNHRQRDLIVHALRHPDQRYTIEYHRDSHNVVYQTARADLLDLVEKKLFRKRKVGRTWSFSPEPDLEVRLRTS
jgi:Fic family protein